MRRHGGIHSQRVPASRRRTEYGTSKEMMSSYRHRKTFPEAKILEFSIQHQAWHRYCTDGVPCRRAGCICSPRSPIIVGPWMFYKPPAHYSLLITPHIGPNGNNRSAKLVQQEWCTTKCLHVQSWRRSGWLKVQIKIETKLKIFVERCLHAHQTILVKRNLLNVDQKARSSPRSLPYLPRRVGRYATASFFDNLSEPHSKERTDG